MTELVQIVEQITPELGEAEGEPTPLEGGITNRNYLVTLGGKRYVIRVPGKDTNLLGIDRSGERDANQGAAEVGIAPPVAALLTDPPALVTEFVEGTGMEADDLQEPDALKQIAGELRSYHDSSVSLPTEFDSFSLVREYAETARSRGVEPPPAYEESLANADAIQARLSGPEHEPVPCHNDLLAANFIRGADTIWIVDWEYAGMGDRYFDLGNFSVNNELDEAGQAALLRGLLRRGAERATARDAVAVPLHVGLPRGDVGRRAERGQRHRLRLQRVRDQALRAHGRDRGRPQVPDLARGGWWLVRSSCPTPPAA